MIGIYIICLIVFPICVLIPMRKNDGNEKELLSKKESDFLKGIATSFVILAHLTIKLGEEYRISVLKVFTLLGGLGVLIFFFLSGYGLYKVYSYKSPNVDFIKRRVQHVVYPWILMKICFLLSTILLPWAKGVSLNYADWFVIVILIEYGLFYVAWAIVDKTQKKYLVSLNFLFSLILALVFWKQGQVAGWYNSLMLFPIGMLVAKYDKEIEKYLKKDWIVKFIGNIVIFAGLGVIFTLFKGMLWADFFKTVAGIFMVLLFCTIFIKVKFESKVMAYVGRNSLYYYIVHVGIMAILNASDRISGVQYFYITLLLTIPLAEILSIVVRVTTDTMKRKR